MSASRKRISKRKKTYVMKGCNRKGCTLKNCSKHSRKRGKKRSTYKIKGGCGGGCVLGGGMKGGTNAYTPALSLPNAITAGSPMPYNSYQTGDVSREGVSERYPVFKGGYSYPNRHSRSNRKLTQKGGWRIIPQDATNFGRGLTSTVVGAYNALQGYPQPLSHLPYEDQFPKKY